MSTLKSILKVRSYREARAQVAVQEQKSVLDRAGAVRHKAEEDLVTFRTVALARETQLNSELCSKTVRLRELSEVNAAIGELRLQTLQRHHALDQADVALTEAIEALVQCKAHHATVWRRQQRFVDFMRMDAEERAQGLEREEEAQLGEAAELIGPRLSLEDSGGSRSA
ncbi:MAG: hypothetical protein RL513_2141 [Pseudomonadota bacterium]